MSRLARVLHAGGSATSAPYGNDQIRPVQTSELRQRPSLTALPLEGHRRTEKTRSRTHNRPVAGWSPTRPTVLPAHQFDTYAHGVATSWHNGPVTPSTRSRAATSSSIGEQRRPRCGPFLAEGPHVRLVTRSLPVYKLRTSRAVQERETQIIMQSPARRSSSVSTESRWSGRPSRTAVSQVPQVPSAQDDRTPIPASSTTSRIERSGDCEADLAAGQFHLEGLGQDRRGQRPGAEPLHAQRPGRPGAAAFLHGGQQGLGPAAVNQGVLAAGCPGRCPGRAARSRPEAPR